MNVDQILQWCVFADYPIFRRNSARYRDQMNKIILYPSRHHGKLDLEAFAKQALLETWVDPVAIDYAVEDWRQAETTPCLAHANSEWLWFTEQDFFVKDSEKFFADIEKAMKHSDMIGWWNPTHFPYVHPSCLFIKREMFEKTQKDFRAHPEIDGCDHFAMLTVDVRKAGGKITTLQDLGYENWKDAFHLGGLTYVYQDWKGDGTDHFGVASPEAFFAYNNIMRNADVEQSPDFLSLAYEVETMMKQQFKFGQAEIDKWKMFFE